MRLRPGKPGDAAAIAQIHVRAWKAAYPGLLPQDYLDALRPEDRLGLWEQALSASPGPAVLVAEDAGEDGHGRLVGFCSYGPSGDEDADPATTGEVYTIYIDPAAWAAGTGKALLDAAVRALRHEGFATATLWVLGVNAAARGFYEHLGWAPDGASKQRDWEAFVATDVRYRRSLR